MPTKTSYAHGQFSWVDLASHDMSAAGDFYANLFGWSVARQDTQGGPPYAEFQLDGKSVGGLGQLNDEMKGKGIPPTWNSYINVDDIETTVRKAEELGATITVPVMKVLDAGSLAFLMDPTGGHVGLWQKGTHAGAAVVNDPGAFCWNELATRDVEKAKAFFGELLGWTFESHDHAPGKYFIIKNGDEQNGGIMEMTAEWGDVPPYWAVYFTVADLDDRAGRVTSNGGRILHGPFDTPVGPMAVCADPQGAVFTLIQMATPKADC